MRAAADIDTLVIGGGLVGLCVAYGLARAGQRVRVLDEGDIAFRAARGNFGLVWVQGKGRDRPDYARWTMASARQWPAFAAELAQRTGVDVCLAQPGGLTLCLPAARLGETDGAAAFVLADTQPTAAPAAAPLEVTAG